MSCEAYFTRSPLEVSVTIPVRDECANIEPICRAFATLMQTNSCIREVIFVDDGSSDGTPDQIERCERCYGFVRFLNHNKSRGKGAAVKLGFAESQGQVLVMMDGDQQYTPSDIPRLIEPILSDSADLVVGRGTNTQRSTVRRLLSRAYRAVFTRIFGLKITCPNEGLKAILKARFEELGVVATGFDFDIGLLVRAKRKGLRIVQVQVNRFERIAGRSKVSMFTTALLFLGRMTRLWVWYHFQRK